MDYLSCDNVKAELFYMFFIRVEYSVVSPRIDIILPLKTTGYLHCIVNILNNSIYTLYLYIFQNNIKYVCEYFSRYMKSTYKNNSL